MATSESAVEFVTQATFRRARHAWALWTGPGMIFYASTMLANAVGLAFFFVMARLLTRGELAELVILTAAVNVFSVIARSLQAKTAQTVTALRGDEISSADSAAVVLRRIARPLLISTGLILLAGAAISPVAARFLKLDSIWPIIVLGAYVASHFLLAAPRGLLLGTRRRHYLSGVTVLDPVVRLMTAVVFVRFLPHSTGALLGYVAGNLVSTLVAAAPFLARQARARVERIRPLRWMVVDRQFLFALFTNGALMGLAGIDPLAIRRFFTVEVADHYAAAYLLGRVILLSANAASWVVFSRAIDLRRHDSGSRTILLRGLALSGGIAVFVTLGYWIAPELAVKALGGAEFHPAMHFVGLVGLEMVLFSLLSVLAYYHLAIYNIRLMPSLALALGAEAVLLLLFHATPYHVLLDTLVVLTGLLLWLSVETVRELRPLPLRD
jgi:hypothetical protein